MINGFIDMIVFFTILNELINELFFLSAYDPIPTFVAGESAFNDAQIA